MEKLINLFSPTTKDVLYDAAMSAANAFATVLSLHTEGEIQMELDKNVFHKIFPNDPKSPAIHWMSDNQYLIFYPPHSKPYHHSFESKCKFIEVLSGVIYDANSDIKLFKGDRYKLEPKSKIQPHTLDQECYLRVCIGDCDFTFEQICK